MERKASKGSILMLVVIFSMILMTIGLAVIYILGLEEMNSRIEIVNARALYLTDSGIEMAKAWLVNLKNFPETVYGNSQFAPFATQTVTFPVDGVVGNIKVTIYPRPTNHVGVDGHYTISSTGTVIGGAYDVSKNASEIIYISTRTWNYNSIASSYTYRPIAYSYLERPTQRTDH